MSGLSDLAERLAVIIQQRVTNAQMPALGLSVGLAIPPYEEGVSKRERARQALAGKSTAELAEVTRRMGVHLGDYALEEIGLVLIEEGAAPITSFCSSRMAPTSRLIEASLGKMPTTSARRFTSLLRRSMGLVECNFDQCSLGKAMYASTSASAASSKSASL